MNEARMTSLWWGPYKNSTALYLSKFGNKESIVRIRYTGSTNKPPNPIFDLTLQTEYRVQLNANRSFDPENDTLTYQWVFGDGNSDSTGVQVVHEYAEEGEYIVTLVVTDSQGQSQQDTKTVKIGRVPKVTINSPATTDTFYVGQVFKLQGTAVDSSGNPISEDQFLWEVRQHHAGKN